VTCPRQHVIYGLKRYRPEQAVSRILFPPPVARQLVTTIHLGHPLPDASCDLPGSSGGQPSGAPLFGLAPGGVYRASPVTRGTGALLPHRFTLTAPPTPWGATDAAVYSLLHFPSRHRDSALRSTLPCGVRTFLWKQDLQRSSGLLRPAAARKMTKSIPIFRSYPNKEFYYRRGTISSCQSVEAHCILGVGYSYGSPGRLSRARAPVLFRLETAF